MTTTDPRDLDVMAAALNLARRGLGNTAPNPAVGCVLMKDGRVVGRGWTQPGGRPHAEVMALTQAGEAARGATAYVTLEPCAHYGETPPCAEALVKAGVSRVVVAITDPDERVAGRGMQILRDAGIEVTENVCRDEALLANFGFFSACMDSGPLFTLKLATDRDGLIPGPDAQGDDKWITCPEARMRGHLLRAQHDAVLFGIGTVKADDPEYTCRLAGMEDQSPVRVLLDSQLSLSPDSKLLKTLDIAPLWVMCREDAEDVHGLADMGVEIIRVPGGKPDPIWVADELVRDGMTRVLIESGPRVATAFLNAGLVEEVAWFRSDKALGEKGVPAFNGNLLEKLELTRQAVLLAGSDHLELYRRET
ncbi:bifunctional diaminohydroxyphosphoribosylaminopyrimidine deaminase/5-amino-6-(5-phosphoribosylamino)uracil reductase RibD [Pseudomonadota bacterium]